YRQAISVMPNWVEAYINLGTTLYQLNRSKESRQAFAKAVELDPANAIAHFNLGCLCDAMGDTQLAIDEFRTALGRSAEMADAHLNLALAYEKQNQKADAERHFGLYLRYEPGGPWAEYARTRLGALRVPAETKQGKVTPFRKVRV